MLVEKTVIVELGESQPGIQGFASIATQMSEIGTYQFLWQIDVDEGPAEDRFGQSGQPQNQIVALGQNGHAQAGRQLLQSANAKLENGAKIRQLE